jgi:hypothetical protein
MAHYAFLDENNIVTEVIVGRNEDEIVDGISNWEIAYAEVRGQVCKRTSYNTSAGVHAKGGVPFRKNYAGIGMIFDEERDAFYAPQPFPSWILNEETCIWEAPISMPEHDPAIEFPLWNEATQSWEL